MGLLCHRSVGIGNECMPSLCSRLTYFWTDVQKLLYFPKLTSINTQYSSLWDTLEIMLFTKYPHKMKTHWQNQLKMSWKWFNLISSWDLDLKRWCYICPMPLYSAIQKHSMCCLLSIADTSKLMIQKNPYHNCKMWLVRE